MPRRTDISSVLIIGAGPIVIGQACEFDYAGAQACRALREEGFRIVLLNSNPATIMTDPEFADATYIEPIRADIAADIIKREKVDAVLPTMGGQVALNCAMELENSGELKRLGATLIGASAKAIAKAEDRAQFRQAMHNIGLQTPESFLVKTLDDAQKKQTGIGFPTIVRPSFTLGGSGGGIAYNAEEFEDILKRALAASPNGEALIERSLIGWKEFEMEVVRDCNDNCIIVCSVENIDPMGVHTGDSATVAPAQTLTDKEYQIMRDAAIAVLREIGADTGGANVQFAINPINGEMAVIEMNPRVSRSSALASKATGFPIAKVAAKLAIGKTLDELKNEITGGRTPASFEPSLDYVVVKVPRFAFEKFPQTEDILTTQMKSVGEVMAIGRTFPEAMQKALRGLEIGADGFTPHSLNRDEIERGLTVPNSRRLFYIADAFRIGMTVEEISARAKIDAWFLAEIESIIIAESEIANQQLEDIGDVQFRRYKKKGFSDSRLGSLLNCGESAVRESRWRRGIHPVYKRVDSCAAEFPTETAYLYSTYDDECELCPSDSPNKIMILGGGPNRIGQGIEFDYCCVHGAIALAEAGFETLMVNCNPETVSTDYDISGRLFFEPLTAEDVLEIVRREKPKGVVVQFGGQTPLKIAHALAESGAPIIGTPVDAIDRAEDRARFQQLLRECQLKQPPNGIARDIADAKSLAEKIGFPLLARPSYVLGGRAMEILYDANELSDYFSRADSETLRGGILLDKFLDDAIEVDVDAVGDSFGNSLIGGVMEHIEMAGVHSGDSACSLPPHSLSDEVINALGEQTRLLARTLGVVGLINVQFAIQNGDIYVLEVNPRASRTAPFVSKATAVPIAKLAARAMVNLPLEDSSRIASPSYFSVKEAVFPFDKFPGVDVILGPEMRSTGEAMGIGDTFAMAFCRAQMAISNLPAEGCALFSVRDADKPRAVVVAKRLADCGFSIAATGGTAQFFNDSGVQARRINKVAEGRPHVVDLILSDKACIVVNTVDSGLQSVRDSFSIRRSAVQKKVVYFTTIAGADAASLGILHLIRGGRSDAMQSLQRRHQSEAKRNQQK